MPASRWRALGHMSEDYVETHSDSERGDCCVLSTVRVRHASEFQDVDEDNGDELTTMRLT